MMQCENGHIACASCTATISICPSCTCPIGNNRCRALEKVLESVEVPCPNAKYGCNASLSHSQLRMHEPLCVYTPCSCPLRACNFLGFSNDLYTHFSRTHNSAKPIDLYSPKPISLKRTQRFLYLREKTEGIIFVVNHHLRGLDSAVNVICVAPGSSSRRFHYDLRTCGNEWGELCKTWIGCGKYSELESSFTFEDVSSGPERDYWFLWSAQVGSLHYMVETEVRGR